MRNILALLIGVVIAAGAISACSTTDSLTSTTLATFARVTDGEQVSVAKKPVEVVITQLKWVGYWQPTGPGEDLCREGAIFMIAYGGNHCDTQFAWEPGPAKDWWPADWMAGDPAPHLTVVEPSGWDKVVGILGIPERGICKMTVATFSSEKGFLPWTGFGTITYKVKSLGRKEAATAVVVGCKG